MAPVKANKNTAKLIKPLNFTSQLIIVLCTK